MLESITQPISSVIYSLYPEKRSMRSAIIQSAGSLLVAAVALAAMASLPTAAAQKPSSSDDTYNLLRSVQTATEQGAGAGLERAVDGMLFGNANADALQAASRSFEQTKGAHPVARVAIAAVDAGITHWKSGEYQSCMDRAEGFLDMLICQIFKP